MEQDLEDLRKDTSKWMRFAMQILVPSFIGLLLVAGFINLHFCSRFAELEGLSTTEIIRDWFAGIDASAYYLGKHIRALQCWVTGLTQFAAAGILVLLWVGVRRRTQRNARILEFMDETCRQESPATEKSEECP